MEINIDGIKVYSDGNLSSKEIEAAVRAEKVFYQAEGKEIESIEIILQNDDMLLRIKEKVSATKGE